MENQIFRAKFVLALTMLLSLSNFSSKASGDDVTQSPITCLNCSKCEYPCQQQPSPPVTYAAPPPPPPPYGYSIYGSPPPPPKEKDHSKCPPAASVQCCTPADPYILAPPNPYTPVPYDEAPRTASMLQPVLVPLMMLFSPFMYLF